MKITPLTEEQKIGVRKAIVAAWRGEVWSDEELKAVGFQGPMPQQDNPWMKDSWLWFFPVGYYHAPKADFDAMTAPIDDPPAPDPQPGQRVMIPMTNIEGDYIHGLVVGVNRCEPRKYCYQCDAPVTYLFSDGRCGKCTREMEDLDVY